MKMLFVIFFIIDSIWLYNIFKNPEFDNYKSYRFAGYVPIASVLFAILLFIIIIINL